MLDPHSWGTPVRQYTGSDVGEMLAHYDDLRAKFYPAPPALQIAPEAAPPEPPKPVRKARGPLVVQPGFCPIKAAAHRMIREAAERNDSTFEEVLGERRYSCLSKARREACWLIAKTFTKEQISLAGIGRIIRMDHTSVLHAVRLGNDIMRENVRGAGGVPETRREQTIKNARRSIAKQTPEQRHRFNLRRAELRSAEAARAQ